MRKLITILLAVVSCYANAQTGDVLLLVEGIDEGKGGQLSAGIFEQEKFPNVGLQLIGREVKVSSSKMQLIFKGVPTGTYGAAVFHDLNANKDLETNFVGLPKEPIGFSNDARIKFGPPSFEDAKFTVESGKQVTLKIILR